MASGAARITDCSWSPWAANLQELVLCERHVISLRHEWAGRIMGGAIAGLRSEWRGLRPLTILDNDSRGAGDEDHIRSNDTSERFPCTLSRVRPCVRACAEIAHRRVRHVCNLKLDVMEVDRRARARARRHRLPLRRRCEICGAAVDIWQDGSANII
jgi:hypothetical protein